MTDTSMIQFKSQPITLDFFMSQLRLAVVAVLAYGGGAHWFTPEAAGLYLTLFTTLGPITIPWAWSIVANYGKVFVDRNSAAAVVAKVEAVDKQSAAAGATNALIANSGNMAAPTVAAALIVAMALLTGLLAFPGDASAQVNLLPKPRPLTGNIAKDFGLGGQSSTTSGGLNNILGALDDKLLPDLQYALKLATAADSKVTAPCYQSWIDLIQKRKTAVTNADGTPMDLPMPRLITDFEKAVELRNALQPDSDFMRACSPVANMVKQDMIKFIGMVLAGGAGLATLVPGL